MNWIFFIILLIEIIFIGHLEKKIWGTFFTPFNFLSVPYAIVLFFNLLVGPSFGFFEIYWVSIFIWVIGLFIFWLPSLFIGIVLFKKTGLIKMPFKNIPVYIRNLQLINIITIVSLFFIYYKIAFLSQIHGIGSSEFEQVITHGFDAHLSILLRFILIIYIVKVNRKDKLIWLLILLIIFAVVISGSKSWLLSPIISGLMIRLILTDNKIKISFKLILFVISLIFLVFFIAYYFSIGKNVNLLDYSVFLIHHIVFYFSAGIVAFSEYIKNFGETAINPLLVIGTPINLFNVIVGHDINVMVSDLWTVVNIEGKTSNVKTVIGTMYIYAGWFYGLLYLTLFSFLHYVILLLSIINKNYLLVIIYFFWSSLLVFGWFEMYYHLVAYYELPIWGVILYFVSKLRMQRSP